eukprot:6201450-Pleurochrysis_carterae.AAC.3
MASATRGTGSWLRHDLRQVPYIELSSVACILTRIWLHASLFNLPAEAHAGWHQTSPGPRGIICAVLWCFFEHAGFLEYIRHTNAKVGVAIGHVAAGGASAITHYIVYEAVTTILALPVAGVQPDNLIEHDDRLVHEHDSAQPSIDTMLVASELADGSSCANKTGHGA